MNAGQESVSAILRETVSMLCRSALTFQSNVRIQGLLGITVDGQQIFLVPIDESVSCPDDQNNKTKDCSTDSNSLITNEMETETSVKQSTPPEKSTAALHQQHSQLKLQKMSDIGSKQSHSDIVVKTEQYETVEIPDDDVDDNEIEIKYSDYSEFSQYTDDNTDDNANFNQNTAGSSEYAQHSSYYDTGSAGGPSSAVDMTEDQWSNCATAENQTGSSFPVSRLKNVPFKLKPVSILPSLLYYTY